MTVPAPVIPLREAVLCLEEGCGAIYPITAGRCPWCASVYMALLASWIDRRAEA